jgi:hypothetical protein
MTFLQPFILWGLPLILVPVIIHLINRLRHKPQPWAAMRFLLSATRASTSHAKLRQILILLFRVFAVLMLVLFLARPLAGGWMGWMLSPAPDVVLVLLDRSASMESKTPGNPSKREQAIKLISQAGREFEGASRFILIDSALRSPQELASAGGLTDPALTGPTDTASDFPALLQAAFTYLVENRAGSAEIWIASDLQRSNWHPDDVRLKNAVAQLSSLPQKVRVRFLAMTESAAGNLAVTLQDVLRRTKGDRAQLQLTVDLMDASGHSTSLPVKLMLDGSEAETQTSIDGQTTRWRHAFDLGQKKDAGWGSLALPVDTNPRDNQAYFVYGGEIPLRTLVVAADSQSSRFLKLAAGVVAQEPSFAQQVTASGFPGASLEGLSLILWQDALPAGDASERLQKFVEEGGVVVFFPTGTADATEFMSSRWGESQTATDERGFQIVRWDEDQGPLAKSDEGFSLPLAQTEFKRRDVISGQHAVVAAFDDGTPFLVRKTVGRGQVYFCASLPDSEWSTLGEGPVLVPMLQRLLQTGSRRLQQVNVVNCGEMSVADLQRQWAGVEAPGAKNVRLHAGVYRSGDRWLAVNRPPSEDEPELLELNEARQLFAGMPFQLLEEKQQRTDALQGEIWRLFLFGMLLFLVGESLLILPGRTRTEANAPLGKPDREEVTA